MENKIASAMKSEQKSYDGKVHFAKLFSIPLASDDGAFRLALELASTFDSLKVGYVKPAKSHEAKIQNAITALYTAQNLSHNRDVVRHNFTVAYSTIIGTLGSKLDGIDLAKIAPFFNGEIKYEDLFAKSKPLTGTFVGRFSVVGKTGTKYEGDSSELLKLRGPETQDMVDGIASIEEEGSKFLKLLDFVNKNADLVKERFKNRRMAELALIKYHTAPTETNSLVEFYESQDKKTEAPIVSTEKIADGEEIGGKDEHGEGETAKDANTVENSTEQENEAIGS